MKKFIFIFLFILLIGIFVSGCSANGNVVKNNDYKVTVYKSANCGCCVGYTAELRKQGFDVETINTEDMSSIKNKYNIPGNMQSCHTAIIGDYFVEGHVPIEAVNKLLEEKPDIDGIALPAMPSGSPGMPGPKLGSFEIYSLTNGKVNSFMEV